MEWITLGCYYDDQITCGANKGSTSKVLLFWAQGREEGRDVRDQVTRGDVLANWREADRTLLA